jgi:Dehydrogenases with different specificities (related to short-chain alcohol dehydrogenases)
MDLKLKDRVALVTGASKGLGAATAEQLSSEGAKVIINSRDSMNLHATAKRIQQKTGNPVTAIAGDVTQPDFPAQLIAAVVEQFGGLDILITNAGGPPAGAFDSFSDADWQRAFESNLMSHVRLIRAALPALEKSPYPAVLTITSSSVKQPIPNLILSNSIRAATVGLTKSLALELGVKNIRFNSILPGWTKTERVEHLLQGRADQNHTSRDIELQKQASESALKRLAEPAEFAAAATFLVSPLASYITGVMLSVDGGSVKGLL